ncbi:protein phosphatase [Streptacidiphilus sp. PB12-B1b]|uniref:PP2C family protein-serine/threonine phosphatase n=1 Tax=Streptacidiphilus sp. PB12-B1b TaxID=2705012 RepID=UPI0015F85D9E|nr:PP2C family protein-serine/threonine phosphatase [Streptacidiphilus sp. PB12-B1b]QMU75491.1 protein phosphatase [Streptacidiphilus sp. PB12-B1b]
MDQLTLSCPRCAQPVAEGDRFCEGCGIELPAAAPAVPPMPAEAPVTDPRAGLAAAPPATPSAAAPPPPPPVPPSVPPGSTGDFLLAAPAGVLVSEPDADADAEPDHEPTEVVPVVDPEAGPVCIGCGARRFDTDGYCEACGRSQPRPRDHQERALAGVCGVSDRGHRHHRNEDAFAVAATSRPGGVPAVVAVVCDGVSSATRPDEASQAAADIASEHLLEALESGTEPKAAMHDAIMAAAARVERLAAEGPLEPSRNSPACTVVSAVASEGEVTIGWVGDSRAYWIPDERSGSERLTLDDSWAARMVEAGLMEEAEAYADPRAHAITGWLGADAVEVEPHTTVFTPDAPGVVLVCTDGLWNYEESAAALAAVVPADARTRPLEAAQELVRFACARGGHDNVTVAVLPCLPLDVPEEPTPTLKLTPLNPQAPHAQDQES